MHYQAAFFCLLAVLMRFNKLGKIIMYWAIGYDEKWKRDIGYDVAGTCDYPGCEKIINRGIDHVCGGEPYGGDIGCGLYFCAEHLEMKIMDGEAEPSPVCAQCAAGKKPFEPTPDVAEWLDHKNTSIYWAGWRTYHENKDSS